MYVSAYIRPAVNFHFYVFPVTLILSVLHWLCSFAETQYQSMSLAKRHILVYGISTICCIFAFLFIGHSEYRGSFNLVHRDSTYLDLDDAIKAFICFIVTGVAAGLHSATYLSFKGRMKIIPPLVAGLTVIGLFISEFIIVGAKFFTYLEIPYVPYINVSSKK